MGAVIVHPHGKGDNLACRCRIRDDAEGGLGEEVEHLDRDGRAHFGNALLNMLVEPRDTMVCAPVERSVAGDRRSQQRSIRQTVPQVGSLASCLIRGGTHVPRVEVTGAIEPEAHDPGGGDADQLVGEPRAERSTSVPEAVSPRVV